MARRMYVNVTAMTSPDGDPINESVYALDLAEPDVTRLTSALLAQLEEAVALVNEPIDVEVVES